jgi:hypothetical protein
MIEQYNLSFLNLKSIENVILRLPSNTHGLLTNGTSSFNVGMPLLLHKELHGLYVIIQQYVKLYTSKYNLQFSKMINSWYNITEPESELQKHNHGNNGLSGALYVSVGNKSVPLIFPDTEIQPYSGLFIIFPSHLNHYTEKEKERRVVISFNTEFL